MAAEQSETNIVRQCLERASKLGHRLWRQQVGTGWIGKARKLDDGYVIIQNARPFHAGFEGLLDTGGFTLVTVTPEMVGKKIPLFTEIEVKTKTGAVRDAQRKRISYIRSVGGYAGIARCADDVDRIINGEIMD